MYGANGKNVHVTMVMVMVIKMETKKTSKRSTRWSWLFGYASSTGDINNINNYAEENAK